MSDICSNYLVGTDPAYYGVQQEDFQTESRRIVAEGVQLIKSNAPFPQLLEVFRARRKAIAEKHSTPAKELFGLSRTDAKSLETGNSFFGSTTSYLAENLPQGNARFLGRIAQVLSTWKSGLETFSRHQGKIEETVGSRTIFYELQVIESNDPFLGQIQRAPLFPQQTSLSEAKRIKTERPEEYKSNALKMQLVVLNSRYKSPERCARSGREDYRMSLFFLGTLRATVKGKSYLLGRHLTWLYRDHAEDPITRMIRCSRTLVTHEDVHLIGDTLEEAEKIFQECLAWEPSQGLESLQRSVAMLRFYFAYCMPHWRGDGAIGDWLELAIYHHHGFTKTRHKQDVSPPYAPLSCITFSDYFKWYKEETIIVE